MSRGNAWMGWVVALLAMVVGWPGIWAVLEATLLRAVIEETIEVVATLEAPEDGLGPLRRGALVEGRTWHVGWISWPPHLGAGRRTARGPPLIPWSVVDEVHDRERT